MRFATKTAWNFMNRDDYRGRIQHLVVLGSSTATEVCGGCSDRIRTTCKVVHMGRTRSRASLIVTGKRGGHPSLPAKWLSQALPLKKN